MLVNTPDSDLALFASRGYNGLRSAATTDEEVLARLQAAYNLSWTHIKSIVLGDVTRGSTSPTSIGYGLNTLLLADHEERGNIKPGFVLRWMRLPPHNDISLLSLIKKADSEQDLEEVITLVAKPPEKLYLRLAGKNLGEFIVNSTMVAFLSRDNDKNPHLSPEVLKGTLINLGASLPHDAS